MVLLDVARGFKAYFSWAQPVVVDDFWDQLNRSAMFILMVVCGTIVTVRGHVGNIIACNGFTKMKKDFVNDYCWTQGLYTVEEAYDKPLHQIPYPGLLPEEVPACMEQPLFAGGYVECPDPSEIMGPTRAYHLWYQWVPFYFWLAAAAFFLPYIIFRMFGFAEVKMLCDMIHNPMGNEEDLGKTAKKATTWLYYRFSVYMGREGGGLNAYIRRHSLGILHLAVKIMYLAATVIVLFLTSRMFTIGNYLTYGEEWALSAPFGQTQNSTLVKNKLFPKLVACEIKRWGASGIEEERGMCVLAPNVINQYLFLIEWFCLVFLIVTNIFSIILCVAKYICIFATYRKLLATSFLKNTKLNRHLYYGIGTTGRLTLHALASNVGPKMMEDIVTQLATRLRKAGLLEGFSSGETNENETET